MFHVQDILSPDGIQQRTKAERPISRETWPIWGSAFDRRQTPDRLYDLPGFSFTFSFRTLQRKTYLCSSLLPLCFSYIAQGGFWYRTFIYGMIEGSFIPVTGSMFRWQTAMGGEKTMCMMPVCLNRLYVSEVSEAGFFSRVSRGIS